MTPRVDRASLYQFMFSQLHSQTLYPSAVSQLSVCLSRSVSLEISGPVFLEISVEMFGPIFMANFGPESLATGGPTFLENVGPVFLEIAHSCKVVAPGRVWCLLGVRKVQPCGGFEGWRPQTLVGLSFAHPHFAQNLAGSDYFARGPGGGTNPPPTPPRGGGGPWPLS